MSYILDALKKADAERERIGVPGLHAETAAAGLSDESRHGAGPWRAIALGALALLALGALYAWWSGGAPAREDGSTVPAAAPSTLPAAASALPTAAPPTSGLTTANDASPAQRTITAPPAAVTVPSATPSPPPPVATAAPPTVIVPSAPPAAAPTAAAPSSGAASRAAAADVRVPTLDELAPDIRRQLPTMVVGGAVYSPSAASRMVVINNQVLREGDRVAEGLVVERIGMKGTVLSLRGTRFELRH